MDIKGKKLKVSINFSLSQEVTDNITSEVMGRKSDTGHCIMKRRERSGTGVYTTLKEAQL